MQKVATIRTIAVAAALVVAGASANANLTIPTNALVANSVQAFSQVAVDGFNLAKVTVTPLGNASAVANTPWAYSLPITSITIGSSLNIVSGDAKGSALQIWRTLSTGEKVGFTLANFTINYDTKQVLADTTPLGGATEKQKALYDFTVATPLALKYKFPLSITGHEVLNNLLLTPESKQTMIDGLQLKLIERIALDTINEEGGFGTLTQDIAVQFRPKPVSTKLYVPQ